MARRLGADKEIEKLRKQAVREGWDVTITGGNHIRWRSPDGETTVISGLTGATPGWIKAKNQLKKAGLAA
jgi:predicted RNA binding protein YcfA (HicA-like mRNA interferase family)